jgi:hypothetical protein
MVYEGEVALGMSISFLRHWKLGEVPVEVIVNEAAFDRHAIAAVGCVMTSGTRQSGSFHKSASQRPPASLLMPRPTT